MTKMIGLALALGFTLAARSADHGETGADNWPSWRGPAANGVAPPGANPPIRWDAASNIRWKAELPGPGSATPIIWGNQVFVVTAAKTDRQAKPDVVGVARVRTPIAVRQHATLLEPVIVRSRLAVTRRRGRDAQGHFAQNGWLEDPGWSEKRHTLAIEQETALQEIALKLGPMQLCLLPQKFERRDTHPSVQLDPSHRGVAPEYGKRSCRRSEVVSLSDYGWTATARD